MNKAYKQYFDLIFGSTLLTLGIYLFVTPQWYQLWRCDWPGSDYRDFSA